MTREELEKQILEILREYDNMAFSRPSECAKEIASLIEHKQTDEEYLNDCIKRATPNLSKIKDVDKTLDEIRGIEPDCYPKEFVEWWFDQKHTFGRVEYVPLLFMNFKQGSKKKYTLDELFIYWQTNIKEK